MRRFTLLAFCTFVLLINARTAKNYQLQNGAIIDLGCSLTSEMELTHCVDSYGSSLNEMSLKLNTVPTGFHCILQPASGDIEVVTCSSGEWKLSVTYYRKQAILLNRRKRSWLHNFICSAAGCSLSCPELCPQAPTNQSPTISCPVVTSNFYTEKEQVTSFVLWSPATATDPEDGALGVTQTQGIVSGTLLGEGTYTITYTAKDSVGATVTCSFTFNVIVRRCPVDYTTLSHGTASCHPPNTTNIYGSQCSYSCAEGYELVGSSLLECGSNQTWNNIKPTCRAVSCGTPTNVSYGTFNCSGTTYQSTCVLSCSSGFRLDNNATVRCQANRQWTAIGTCLDVEPPVIRCQSNINVYAGPKLTKANVTWPLPNTTDNSGTVSDLSWDIPSGSLFDVGQTPVTFTATDPTDNLARCISVVNVTVKRCFNYTSITNGVVNCSHGNAHGSECTTTCNQGYEIESTSTQTCLDNLTWSGVKPVCKPRVCSRPTPPDVANGTFVCPNGRTYQSVCNLNCSQGYKAMSPLTIQCDINIQWTEKGSCLDVEPPNFPTGCPASFEVPAARLGESTYVTYQYPNVTDNSGQSVVVVGSPVSGASFNMGTTTVNITARDVQGNTQPCSFQITIKTRTCAAPNLDNTGTISYDCPNGYVYGAECTLSCTEGTPVIGPSTITCDNKGSSKDVQWVWSSNNKPYCTAQTCSRLPSPTNGAMSCEKLSPAGEVCAIMCNTNFTYPASAPEQYICLSASGRWNPNNFVPNCTVRIRPGQLITKPSIYYFTGDCSKNRTDIKEKFRDFISSLGLEESCENQCTLDNIDVTCGRGTNSKRKKRSGMSYEYKVSTSITFGQLKTSSQLRYLEDLVSSVNDHLENKLISGAPHVLKFGVNDMIERGESVISCEPGTLFIYRTMSCAGCGPGHMYTNETNSCTACPPGTYQDQEISFSCRPCPSGTYTKQDMATSLSQCEEMR